MLDHLEQSFEVGAQEYLNAVNAVTRQRATTIIERLSISCRRVHARYRSHGVEIDELKECSRDLDWISNGAACDPGHTISCVIEYRSTHQTFLLPNLARLSNVWYSRRPPFGHGLDQMDISSVTISSLTTTCKRFPIATAFNFALRWYLHLGLNFRSPV